MPTVVATEMSAKRARTPLMTSSPHRRRTARRRISVSVIAPVATRLPAYLPYARAARSARLYWYFALASCRSVSEMKSAVFAIAFSFTIM